MNQHHAVADIVRRGATSLCSLFAFAAPKVHAADRTEGTARAFQWLATCAWLLYTAASNAGVLVLTQHNDPQRTGANLAETVLTPAKVASPDFIQQGSYPVRGQVFAQPLYASGVNVVGQGERNIVFFATAGNMLYAYDADRTGEQAILWSFDAGSGITANAAQLYPGRGADISPEVGIMGTPVIDLAHSTIYFVAMTQPVRGREEFFHTLHAVNITNGQERGSIRITGTIDGGGVFNSARQNQRAALALMGDRVFVAWAGFGDISPYDGLVMSYGTIDSGGGLLKHEQFQVARFDPVLGSRHKSGGIWHSGGGPAIDERNQFMYVVTGNGSSQEAHAGQDFDSSDVKLDSTLRVIDYFTPSFQGFLNDHDLDLSVSGPMIPSEWRDRRGNLVRRLLHGSKQGILYNLNRDNMGHFHADSNPIQQVSVFDEPNPGETKPKLHIHTTPTLWFTGKERRIYVASDWGLGIRAYRMLDDGQLETTPFLTARDDRNRYALNQLSLSANGSQDGVLWTIGCVACVFDNPPDTLAGGKQGILLAYDASRLGSPLFASSALGVFPRFNAVTVANGRVYVPTFSGQVAIFGMRESVSLGTGAMAGRNLLQGNWGRRGNFEMLLPQGSQIGQYARDNDAPAFPWLSLRNFGYRPPPNSLGPTPTSVSFIQSNFKGDGVHGNFEAVVRVAPPLATQPHHLDFWFMDSRTARWSTITPILADGQPISGVTGDPVMLQGNWGQHGNFEMLVPVGTMIRQYVRDNDSPNFPWHLLREFGYRAPPNSLGPTPRSITFFQSSFKGDGVHGNFEAVVRVAPPLATQPHHLDFWFMDSATARWNGPFSMVADGMPIEGVTGDPVMLQGDWGRRGNFEMLVPVGNMIRQYFRDNDDPAFPWHFLREFGYPTLPNTLGSTPRDVTFLQSTFKGDGAHGNFEVIVRVASPVATQPDRLDFWFLDSRTSAWNGPFAVEVGGQPIQGITGF